MRRPALHEILLVALATAAAGGACLALTGNVPLAVLQGVGWGAIVALAARPRMPDAVRAQRSKSDVDPTPA